MEVGEPGAVAILGVHLQGGAQVSLCPHKVAHDQPCVADVARQHREASGLADSRHDRVGAQVVGDGFPVLAERAIDGAHGAQDGAFFALAADANEVGQGLFTQRQGILGATEVPVGGGQGQAGPGTLLRRIPGREGTDLRMC